MSDKKEDQLGQLYENAQKLSSTKGEEGESLYMEMIAAVKGDKGVKTLAAQQLPKYFARFPKLQEQSLNAQLDLCEDESSIIRMYAINGLVETCKNSPHHRKQIADVLGQLLVADEASELAIVQKSFTSLFQLDAKIAFESLFGQLRDGEENVRSKCLVFIKDQIPKLMTEIKKDEALQKTLADGVKSVLTHESGVSPSEFKDLIVLLRSLKIYGTDKELPAAVAAIVSSQAGLGKDFDPTSDDAVQKLTTCIAMAQRLNPPRAPRPAKNADASAVAAPEDAKEEKKEEKKVDHSVYLIHFRDKIAPVLSQVSESNKLQLLKAFADLSRLSTPETAHSLLQVVYDLLLTYAGGEVAPAPAASSSSSSAAAAPAPNAPAKPVPVSSGTAGPKINFSVVEALLVLFHRFAAKNRAAAKEVAGLFTPTGQPSDFHSTLRSKKDALAEKLKVTTESIASYLAQVKAAEQKLTEKRSATKEDEEKKGITEKLKQVKLAIRTAASVKHLSEALLKSSPDFLTSIAPSWNTRNAAAGGPGGKLRKRTASAGAGAGAASGTKRAKTGAAGGGAGAGVGGKRTGGVRGGRRGRGAKRANTGGGGQGSAAGSGGRSSSRGRGGRGGRRGRGRGRGQ